MFKKDSKHSLNPIFKPKTVALIGATETPRSVGLTLLTNLSRSDIKLYPINPKYKSIGGIPCYPCIEAIPVEIDLAVIATPAQTVPAIVASCAGRGVKGAVIISAGFKERGLQGAALEKQILDVAGSMRIIGPNCLGVMNPGLNFNATFAATNALPGSIGFLSQSGAICTSILDWSLQTKVGFSVFASIGSMLDVDWGDLIDYLGKDRNTQSILIYMESMGQASYFLQAAKKVAPSKPIWVIKAGRTQAAAKAAASHTGSLAGADEAFNAALKAVGVGRLHSIDELYDMAGYLNSQPQPKGPKLTIVTNAGGPAVLATDAAIIAGAELSILNLPTIDKLSEILPVEWSHSNPVDLLGDASAHSYTETVKIVSKDDDVDGLLIILTPQAMTDATATANELIALKTKISVPLLTSWMGGASVREGKQILQQHQIPSFPYADIGATIFAKSWHYQKHLRDLKEKSNVRFSSIGRLQKNKARAFLETIFFKGRTILTEWESKELLSLYEIPVVKTILAKDPKEALAAAIEIEFPVAVKLNSYTLTHKSDVGGVKLDLKNKKQVTAAFEQIKNSVAGDDFAGVSVQQMVSKKGIELIVGSSTDPILGPLLLFGSGGSLVEIFKDTALTLPPLTFARAQLFIKSTKIAKALKGVRGQPPVSEKTLIQILMNFSQLVLDHPCIKECEINPLVANGMECLALDARVILHSQEEKTPEAALKPYRSRR